MRAKLIDFIGFELVEKEFLLLDGELLYDKEGFSFYFNQPYLSGLSINSQCKSVVNKGKRIEVIISNDKKFIFEKVP